MFKGAQEVLICTILVKLHYVINCEKKRSSPLSISLFYIDPLITSNLKLSTRITKQRNGKPEKEGNNNTVEHIKILQHQDNYF